MEQNEETVKPKFGVHIHKYQRIKLGRKDYTVFKCMKPSCSHFIRAELVIGMEHQCWRCGETMVMNQWSAMYKKPHCRACTRVHPNPARRPKEIQVA